MEYAIHMGLNTIDTYVPWNLHEPSPGIYRFSGMLDLRYFLEIAHDLNLLVILRPGPYICSEWDLGGLPPYLLADPTMKLRSLHPGFTIAVQKYFDTVAQQILPYMGRPIVAVQIENEFGAYSDDQPYLNWILAQWKKRLPETLYFTSDNGGERTVAMGNPTDMGVLKTINLDWKVNEKMRMLSRIQPNAPRMVAEFWTGWFDHWGESHHTRLGHDVVKYLDEILLDWAGSFNLYMFYGGTNFGFLAGANMDGNGTYLATTTSYDYDAFITEYGGIRTEKFAPARKSIRSFWKMMGDLKQLERMDISPPEQPYMSAYAGTVELYESIDLFKVLDDVSSTRATSDRILTMEEAGGSYGFVMYRHNVSGTTTETSRTLQIEHVRDFAYVFADEVMIKSIDRNKEYEEDGSLKTISIPPSTKRIDVIVENRGRINYGRYLHDRKGILGRITLDGEALSGFEIITLPFAQHHPLLPLPGADAIDRLRERMQGRNEHPPLGQRRSPPTFFRGELSLNPGSLQGFKGEFPGTHIRMFGRGVLWVNGFNVGRFHTGVPAPQRSLYVPGSLFREGRNEIIVLHMNMHLTREPPKVQFFEESDFIVAS